MDSIGNKAFLVPARYVLYSYLFSIISHHINSNMALCDWVSPDIFYCIVGLIVATDNKPPIHLMPFAIQT